LLLKHMAEFDAGGGPAGASRDDIAELMSVSA
jgi:hypothetical protein